MPEEASHTGLGKELQVMPRTLVPRKGGNPSIRCLLASPQSSKHVRAGDSGSQEDTQAHVSTISPKSTPPSRSRVGLSPPPLFPTPLNKVDVCEFFHCLGSPSSVTHHSPTRKHCLPLPGPRRTRRVSPFAICLRPFQCSLVNGLLCAKHSRYKDKQAANPFFKEGKDTPNRKS